MFVLVLPKLFQVSMPPGTDGVGRILVGLFLGGAGPLRTEVDFDGFGRSALVAGEGAVVGAVFAGAAALLFDSLAVVVDEEGRA